MSVPAFATPEDIHAARPDVPLQTIRRHCRDGVIPGAVKAGRSWLVPLHEATVYCETYARYARGVESSPPVDSTPRLDPRKEV